MNILVSAGQKNRQNCLPFGRHMLDTQCNLPRLFLSVEAILSVYVHFRKQRRGRVAVGYRFVILGFREGVALR